MRLSGITVAMVTPFTKDGVNLSAAAELARRLAEEGYSSLFPNSSTGEVTKLSVEERVALARAVREAVSSNVLVMSGTGTGDADSAIRIARMYLDVGVDAIVITPPYYAKPDPDSLKRFYDSILSKLDAPTILYTFPLVTGYNIPVEVLEHVATQHSHVAGVKDSSGDFTYHLRLIPALSNLTSVLQGIDELLVPSLVMGAAGGVLASPNFLGDIPLRLYKLATSGDIGEAVKLSMRLTNLWRALAKWPSAHRYATSLVRGIDLGPSREPSPTLSEDDKHAIEAELARLGILRRENF